MMPLMSLSSLLNILRPTRPAPTTGGPGDDHISRDLRDDRDPPGANGSGGYLVARDGRTLPLRGVSLRAEARGGVARVVLEQRFANPYNEALHVTYLMPLPSDAAVSGYAFVLEGKRIVGEVDRKKKARQRFEQAILEGKTAGIVDQERSSLFTQELGNVPPASEVVAELTIDQKLIWRREGMWEWRFPTAVGPRYVGAPGQVADAGKLVVPVAEGGVATRLGLALAIRDSLPSAARPESPSHRLRSSAAGSCVDVSLSSEEGARLDRDVVVRWPVAGGGVGTSLDLGRPAGQRDSFGLLTLVPPEARWQRPSRRDLILLLDTSGSMDGDPLRQLKRTALALIDSLGGDDTLEMIEFSSSARRWERGAREASSLNKRDAKKWVEGLRAGGGTEMVSGMMEALAPLTERSQRQVILMTDGYIGSERDVITQVMHKLPRGSCRVHVVGVGSSVNRTLTQGVARAGAGVELILAPGEDAERLVGGLLARTAAPLLTHVEVKGNALLANAPAYLPDLYAGSPALISLQLRAEGGSLEVSGYTAEGPWHTQVTVPACREGQGTQALAALFARETVEDLELAHATTTTDHAAIDRAIEDLGLRFQISTRLTTWVAVSQEATVDPSRPGRSEVVAHEVPHGVSVAGLGLRQASAPSGIAGFVPSSLAPAPAMHPGPLSTPMGAPSRESLASAPRSMPASRSPAAYAQQPSSSALPPPSRASERDVEAIENRAQLEDFSTDGPSAIEDDFFHEMPTGSLAGAPPASAEESARAPSPPRQSAPRAIPAEPMTRAKNESEREERSKIAKRESSAAGSGDDSFAPGGPLGGPLGASEAPKPRWPTGPSSLRARLRHHTAGGMMVFEILVQDALVWSPGMHVMMRLADGRELAVPVSKSTTAAGSYAAGHVVRLVIDVGAAEAEAPPIALLVAGRFIPVVVE